MGITFEGPWADVLSVFAARHDMVPWCRHLSLTKCANFGHTTVPIFLENISIRSLFGIIRFEIANLWLVSSTSSHPALSKSASIMKGLSRSSYFAFRGSKWYARPVMLRIQALI